MKKFTLFVAAIMASAAMLAEGTFAVEKVWENLTVPAAADVRQGAGWDGQVFVVDRPAQKIKVITETAVSDYADTEAGAAVGIAVDGAGNIIVKNEWASTGSQSVQLCKKGETTVTTVAFADSKLGGRSDMICAATGDVFSAEGGHVYISLGNDNSGLLCVKIANGAFVELDTIAADWTVNSITLAAPVADGVLVHTRGSFYGKWNPETGKTVQQNLPADMNKSTACLASFELGGKLFYAYSASEIKSGTNATSDWMLYNVTDSVAVNAEKLYLKDHATTNGTSYGNFLTCQKVSDTEVHIYQYHPGNGAAMWKVTYTPAEEDDTTTAVENTTATVKVQKLIRDGQVLMVRDGKTFNMMGQEIR